jgi:DNA-binding MarR family transcriptional regulator
MFAIITSMQASEATTVRARPQSEAAQIAAGLGALMRCTLNYGGGGDYLSAIEESGLTLTQLKVVMVLQAGGEEPRSVKQIAEELGITPPAATRAVDALFDRQLVDRSEDLEDRRVRRIAITARGRDLVEAVISQRMASLEAFAADLSATQRRKLTAAFEALMSDDDFAAAYRSNAKGVRR